MIDKDDAEECQMCWDKPRADPPIWLTDMIDGRPVDRSICMDCAVKVGKDWLREKMSDAD